jgi:hypothetical protein
MDHIEILQKIFDETNDAKAKEYALEALNGGEKRINKAINIWFEEMEDEFHGFFPNGHRMIAELENGDIIEERIGYGADGPITWFAKKGEKP